MDGMGPKERRQYEQLVLTPVGKRISILAVPTVMSMLVSVIYGLVDSFFVARLGTSAAAATGIMASIQSVFQAMGFMFGHGAGSNISLQLGKGNRDEAAKFASTSFFSCIVVTSLVAATCMGLLDPVMRLLGSTETILPYSRSYGFYMFLSGPVLATSFVMNNIMRYEGKAYLATVALVSGAVLNMTLDPILMFGAGMGIAGAGLSTAISECVGFALLLGMFVSGRTISRISPRLISPTPARLWSIFRLGVPNLIRQALNALAVAVLNVSSMPYGDAAIAAMSIVGRVGMVIYAVMVGIGQGMQPVTAYNYGAQKYLRTRRAARFTWVLGESVTLVISTACFVLAPAVVALFREDPDVLRIGIPALRLTCVALAIMPLGTVASMLFQTAGWGRESTIMAMMRNGIGYIPALIVLPRLFGIAGIQVSQLVADVATMVVAIPLLVGFSRKVPREDIRSKVDDEYERAGMA